MRAKIIAQQGPDGLEFSRVEPPELEKFVTVYGARYITFKSPAGVFDIQDSLSRIEWIVEIEKPLEAGK